MFIIEESLQPLTEYLERNLAPMWVFSLSIIIPKNWHRNFSTSADPPVLANYILELLKRNEPRDKIIETVKYEIAEFLENGLNFFIIQ